MINQQPVTRAQPDTGFGGERPRQVVRRGYAGPLRFVETLRGEGMLVWAGGETPVAYELDMFDGNAGRTGSGTLDGVLPEVDGPAQLRLSETTDVAVAVVESDGEAAVFETRGVVREHAPARKRRAKP